MGMEYGDKNSGDGDQPSGDGVGMGTGTTGTDGDRDQFLSPCSSLLGCQLLLITNTKSHMGFRLVPTSVTSNDLEWHNSPYFALLYRI